MRKVLGEVLRKISPSLKEMKAELEFAQMMLEHIRFNAPNGADVVLTGSMAKRTFLRDKKDLDIFVLFPLSVPKDGLERHMKELMARAFPSLGYQLSYAEHPYIRFHFKGRSVDLVPAYKIGDSSERMSAVDRSVLHTRFVKRSLKLRQRGDVLLLKQFLRANCLYGAEIKIQGFSGYLCELLIIRYGGFAKLARAAAKWKPAVFIDMGGFYKGRKKEEAIERFGGFTVIDPTDADRNVAAAVSEESLRRFISACRRLIKNPSKRSFLKKPEAFEQKVARKAKSKHVFVLSMPRPDVVDDVLWGQLRKLMAQLGKHLEDFGASQMIAEDSRHLVRIAIPLDGESISPRIMVRGPPLEMEAHVRSFRKKHRKTSRRGGHIWAEGKRKETKAKGAILGFLEAFGRTDSHLAYPLEMYVLEGFRASRARREEER